MSNGEVHIGDDWWLGENNDGDLIVYNSRQDEVVNLIDVLTGKTNKKGNEVTNISNLQAYSQPETYHIWKKGNMVYAESQDSSLSSTKGSNAATVFQDVIDAMPAGSLIQVEGVFTFDSGITFPKAFRLEGSRMGNAADDYESVLKASSNVSGPLITVDVIETVMWQSSIANIAFNGAAQPDSAGNHLLYLGGANSENIADMYINNIVAWEAGDVGLNIENYHHSLMVANSYFEHCESHGIHAQGDLINANFVGNYLTYNGESGMRVDNITGHPITILGGSYRNNDVYGLNIREGTIVGSDCFKNNQAGIIVEKYSTVLGTRCYKNGGSGSPYGVCLWGDGNRVISNKLYSDGTTQDYGIGVDSGVENRIASNVINNNAVAPINDNGTRTIRNGVGKNAGDPSAGGDWNGHGYEGLMVYDTTNDVKYWFINGNWV